MTLRHIIFSLVVTLCVALFGPSFGAGFGASTAQAQVYLKIDGIAGEATEPGHKDEIGVRDFTYGAEAAIGLGGAAGASVGKAKFEALAFTHFLDRASASLMLALAKGQHIKSAVLTVRKPSAPSEFLRITLTDVLVSSVKASSDGTNVEEAVTLAYAKIQIEYFTSTRDGKLVPGSKMSWDITKNTGG